MHVARFSPEEASAKAAALKLGGTADFQRADWAAAACKYACGVDYARSAGGSALAELLGPLLLNEAQCRLKLSEAHKASAVRHATPATRRGRPPGKARPC